MKTITINDISRDEVVRRWQKSRELKRKAIEELEALLSKKTEGQADMA